MNYGDNKELNIKIFNLKIACLTNNKDQKLLEEMFGNKLKTLARKMINRRTKKENQTIINNI